MTSTLEYRLISLSCISSSDSEEDKSYAVGHFALGYIAAKASTKLTNTKLNIPIVLVLSIAPDADLLVPAIAHRGPTHSIVTAIMVFLPIFAVYRRKAVPYFLALLQHSLVGDYVVGGQTQLLWPVSSQLWGASLSIRSEVNVALESAAFLISLVVMIGTRDIAAFVKPRISNLILTVPLFTVLLPALLSIPLDVPVLLVPLHLTYAFLFAVAIAIGLQKALLW